MLMNRKSNGTRAMGLDASVATASKVSPMPVPLAAAPEKTAPDYVDQAGDNVRIEVSGDELVIRVDLRKDFGLSGSGKTRVVASTRGFATIATHRGVSIALNVNRK